MRENLAYLPAVFKPEHVSTTSFLQYVYGYDSTIVSEAKSYASYQNYGVLYNFPSAFYSCPSGWHLPEKEEWETLFEFLGGNDVAGGN